MAQHLLSYFELAKNIGGLKCQIRLAILTRISSTVAKGLPDTTENIEKFEKAIIEIKKEFNLAKTI